MPCGDEVASSVVDRVKWKSDAPLNSLRMEKADLTRFELTHDIGPYQAGVHRWVRPERKRFIGSDALVEPNETTDWRLVYLRVDAPDGDDAAIASVERSCSTPEQRSA